MAPYDLRMSVDLRRIRPAVLAALCVLGASVLLGPGAGQASATVYAIATASDCSGSSCSNFRVMAWGSTIKPNRSGTVCFKNKCLKTQSSSVGVLTADFNVIGPYRNGSKTSARVKYGGTTYNRNVWINCGC
jgi:hypothetical protein